MVSPDAPRLSHSETPLPGVVRASTNVEGYVTASGVPKYFQRRNGDLYKLKLYSFTAENDTAVSSKIVQKKIVIIVTLAPVQDLNVAWH